VECGDGITLVVLVWWYGNGGDTDVSGVVMIMSTVVTLHTFCAMLVQNMLVASLNSMYDDYVR
jgi:hypothetical protein